MRKCILCGEDTNGSIGKAGIRWSIICQECKDIEDNVLESKIRSMSWVIQRISMVK